MEIQFVDNQQIKLATLLVPAIKEATDTRVAVAFVSNSGLSVLEEGILEALSKRAQIEILVGLDFATTEAKALWRLHQWTKENKTFSFYCLPLGSSGVYHPKMYLMANQSTGSIVVGSSNLTAAGLSHNAEANIFIRDRVDSEVFTDAQGSYVRLKFDGRRIPDEQFLAIYEEKSRQFKSSERKRQTRELKSINSALEENFIVLPKPRPTRKDLIGWLALVYENLPSGEFTNDDVYSNEDIFRAQYPENQNIRAKARQQLQFLRDLGLVESIERGVWRKTGGRD